MKIYDFDNCSLSTKDGMYGGNSGNKEGILIQGENWIIKYPKKADKLLNVTDMSYTQSPESEYIGSHIYEILGYPVHKTLLGFRNNHIVVACKDLCKEGEELIEFRQLKNKYNKELNEKLDLSMSPTNEKHFSNLKEILIHLKYNPLLSKINGLEERFWDCAVIDGFINNNDRNNGNWGIIRKGYSDRMCPVFDNGASFSPNVPESKIKNKYNNFDILQNSSIDGITAYSLDGKNNLPFKDLLKLKNNSLNKSLLKNIPIINKNFNEIVKMIDDIPESFNNTLIISNERKNVYKNEMIIRFNKLLLPKYTEIIKDNKNLNAEIKEFKYIR